LATPTAPGSGPIPSPEVDPTGRYWETYAPSREPSRIPDDWDFPRLSIPINPRNPTQIPDYDYNTLYGEVLPRGHTIPQLPGTLSGYVAYSFGGVARVAARYFKKDKRGKLATRDQIKAQLLKAGLPAHVMEANYAKTEKAFASPRPTTAVESRAAGRIVARAKMGPSLGFGHTTFPGGNPFWASDYLHQRDRRKSLAKSGPAKADPGPRGRPGGHSTVGAPASGRPESRPAGPARPDTVARTPPIVAPKTAPTSAPALPAPKTPTSSTTKTTSSSGSKASPRGASSQWFKTIPGIAGNVQVPTAKPRWSLKFSTSTGFSWPSMSRLSSRPSSRLSTRTATAPATTAQTTVLNSLMPATQTQTQSVFSNPAKNQKTCECDKPRKKSTTPKCSNPLISRVVRDGIVTIKRRLQCR
jgi:hypothetical protein